LPTDEGNQRGAGGNRANPESFAPINSPRYRSRRSSNAAPSPGWRHLRKFKHLIALKIRWAAVATELLYGAVPEPLSSGSMDRYRVQDHSSRSISTSRHRSSRRDPVCRLPSAGSCLSSVTRRSAVSPVSNLAQVVGSAVREIEATSGLIYKTGRARARHNNSPAIANHTVDCVGEMSRRQCGLARRQ
jgi:hypothetical protein